MRKAELNRLHGARRDYQWPDEWKSITRSNKKARLSKTRELEPLEVKANIVKH